MGLPIYPLWNPFPFAEFSYHIAPSAINVYSQAVTKFSITNIILNLVSRLHVTISDPFWATAEESKMASPPGNLSEDRGPLVIEAIYPCGAIATLAVVARFTSRKLKHVPWASDDYMVLVTLVG